MNIYVSDWPSVDNWHGFISRGTHYQRWDLIIPRILTDLVWSYWRFLMVIYCIALFFTIFFRTDRFLRFYESDGFRGASSTPPPTPGPNYFSLSWCFGGIRPKDWYPPGLVPPTWKILDLTLNDIGQYLFANFNVWPHFNLLFVLYFSCWRAGSRNDCNGSKRIGKNKESHIRKCKWLRHQKI